MKMNPFVLVWIGGSRPAARTVPRVVSGYSWRFVNRPARIAAGLVVAALGCVRAEVVESPLIDVLQPPKVLAEGRELRLPNTGPGNRFVSGWRFDDDPAGLTIAPAAGGARLEVVQLRSRSRTLSLVTRGEALGLALTAAAGQRRLEVHTSRAAIEIVLPADLAQGRNLLDLEFTHPSDVRLSGATLSAAAKAGEVVVEGDEIVHRPWSAVDFVRWVEPGTTLVGELAPPSNPAPGQRFAVLIDHGDGILETVFDVTTADEIVPIRVPLRTTGGLVRIRLLAEGEGQAGRWRGLRLQHRRPASRTEIAGPPEAPKIVIVYVLDALRADVVGHLGSDFGATPCMDQLAAEGAVFANHFSVAPNTGPATKSLFTGFGFLRGRTIPEEGPRTLAEDFADAGYRTVSISSNPHLARSFGLTQGFAEVFFEPLDEDFADGADVALTVNNSADRVHQAALKWLDGVASDDRVFLYLHTLNPHNPYTPPEPFPSRFLQSTGSQIDGGTKTLAAIRDRELEVSPEDEQRIREWYTAGAAYNDAALCGFVEELKERYGSRFLLVLTSDHGEELFDHQGVLHGYTLYDELLHVPLVVWWLERIHPTRIGTATDTLDLTAALRALIDAWQAAAPEGGEALWGLIDGGGSHSSSPELHFATAPGLRRAAMVRSERWKLILAPRPGFRWGMGRGRGRTHDAEYVFNLIDDPGERRNLAGAANLEVEWLRSRLNGWVEYWDSRQPEVDQSRPDEETMRQLKALGYAD